MKGNVKDSLEKWLNNLTNVEICDEVYEVLEKELVAM